MKKSLIITALVFSVALTVSCGKSDPVPENGNNGGDIPSVTPAPGKEEEKAPGPVSIKLNVSSKDNPIVFIELTDRGKYLVKETGDEGKTVYTTGSYTVESEGVYKFDNGATLTVNENGSGTSFSLKGNDGKVISGSAEAVKNNSGSTNLDKLCRTWTITKTRISITNGAKANADFNGCDLGEIADFARNQGIEIKRDLTGIKVTSVTLTPLGTAIVLYSTGEIDVVDCDLSQIDKETLTYTWQGTSVMGYEITSGTGTVKFDGGYLILSLDSGFTEDSKRYDVSVTFVMEELK